MRIVSGIYQGSVRWGVWDADAIHLAPTAGDSPTDVHALVEYGLDRALQLGAALTARDDNRIPVAALELGAPLPRPRKNVICLGMNYAAHAAESMRAKGREPELPEHPVVFTKATSCVTGPYADIPLDPAITEQLDWEVELAVIVGARLHKANRATALAGVFGYTIVNDLTARDLQFRHKQFFLGKSVNRSCPMGPALVTADAVPDPQTLNLRCTVNGRVKQDSSTADQIFGIGETLHRLSWVMTLEPGDIIATGTPEGVGFARQPPEFLTAGDVVGCEIEGLGRIENRIVAAD